LFEAIIITFRKYDATGVTAEWCPKESEREKLKLV